MQDHVHSILKKSKIILVLLVVHCSFLIAQHHPGGVTDVEVWYYPTENDIELDEFPNYSDTFIEISNCGALNNSLMNFNPSFESEKLCFEYKTPWENSNNRSLFFVGDHASKIKQFSHFYTTWREDIDFVSLHPPFVRFFANLNSAGVSGLEISETYTPNDLGVINYYHLNNYNIDRKFRSYGETGETSVFIGKQGQLNGSGEDALNDNYFFGNFSEVISFTRALSKNERNRVESYLAIKYGITLKENDSYRTSSNIKIWNQDNFNLFPERVFGLGKDKISNLYQFQSHSLSNPNFLIAAIDEIEENNTIKQGLISIENNQFLVFGDNGGKANLSETNDKGFRYWVRTWLAQRTGTTIDEQPIFFQIQLTPEIQDILTSDEGLDFWLLKDNNADNSEISDFTGNHIEYHPAIIDLELGTATFENISFDPDDTGFDQFTFGVGSKIVVQVVENGCGSRRIPLLITIAGGTADYTIKIYQGLNLVHSDTTDGEEYIFENAEQGETYRIEVADANNISAVPIEITVEAWEFDVDFGPDQYIVANNPNIVLDAGVDIPDSNATYEWFKDNALLDNTLSTLTVMEPGAYKVIVTSEDLTCQVEDEIVIIPKDFDVNITTQAHCFELFNSINIEISGGQQNFTTVLSQIDVDPIQSTTYIHEADLEISELAEGEYNIEISDAWGVTYEEIITLFYEPINLDIHTQLSEYCDPPTECVLISPQDETTATFAPPLDLEGFILNASEGVTQDNITYEWFIDDVLVQTNPIIEFVESDGICDPIESRTTIKAIATNTITNCNEHQSFTIKANKFCLAGSVQTTALADNSGETDTRANESTILNAVIYPNPSKKNTVFIYEIYSTEVFNGVVEIFTLTGKSLVKTKIKDQKRYALPFNLKTSGMYLIRTTTKDGSVVTKRVIIE